jgi:hypothetical protein
MSDKYSPAQPDNSGKNSNSPAIIAAIAVIAAAAITGVATVIAASIGSIHFSAPGGAAPAPTATVHPTVTVTVTKGADSLSGSTIANSALLKSVLLSAQTVDSGMKPVSNAPSIIEICNAVAPTGAQSMATETLNDPLVSRMFTETIIRWGSPAEAADSIRIDGAEAESDCQGISGQYTQGFSGYAPGTASYQCGGGPEVSAILNESTSSPSSAYTGEFIAEQCNNFTISIEDVNSPGKYIPDDGFLNDAAGRSPIINSAG